MIELSVWSTGDYVLDVKSYFIIYEKRRSEGSMSICIFLMSKLCSEHFGSEMVDYVLKILDNGSGWFRFTSS